MRMTPDTRGDEMTKRVMPNEFVRITNETVLGSTFVGVLATTKVKLNKKSRVDGTPCPYTDVIKLQRFQAGLGWDYETRVQKVTGDDEFHAGPHAWKAGDCGHFIINAILEPYLPMHVQRWMGSRYIGTDVKTGKRKLINKSELTPYMAVHKDGENPSEIRSYKVENLRKIRMNKITYVIETEQRKHARMTRERMFNGAVPLQTV
jgi:hypothetical protein